MDLAYREFDEVRVVALSPGTDPAEAADGFAARLETAKSYPRYRVKLEIDRAPTREAAFQRVQAVVAAFDQNTEWLEAIEYASDQLDLPHDLRSARATGLAGDRRGSERWQQAGSGSSAVRSGCSRTRSSSVLAEADEEHFDSISDGAAAPGGGAEPIELVSLRAELDALAASEGINEDTASSRSAAYSTASSHSVFRSNAATIVPHALERRLRLGARSISSFTR